MIYPYENYLKLLMVRGYSDPIIANKIRALKLIPPTDVELETKREELNGQIPDKCKPYMDPENFKVKSFMEVLKNAGVSLGIEDMIPNLEGKKDDAWETALLIMVDLDARIIVQSLSLFGYTNRDIIGNLKNRIGLEVTVESLNLFYKYFWNLKGLSKLELYHYIATCSIAKHRELLMDAYHKKAQRIKWHMTGTNILTLEGVLEDVLNTSYEKYKACSDGEDTAANDNRTISWANMAVTAAEKLKNAVTSANEVAMNDVQFELQQLRQEDIIRQEDLNNVA